MYAHTKLRHKKLIKLHVSTTLLIYLMESLWRAPITFPKRKLPLKTRNKCVNENYLTSLLMLACVPAWGHLLAIPFSLVSILVDHNGRQPNRHSGLFFSCHLRVNFFTVNCFWFSSCTCLLAHTPGNVKAKPRKKPFEICKEFCAAYLMRKKRSQSQMQNKSNGSNAMAQLNLVTKRGCFTRPT